MFWLVVLLAVTVAVAYDRHAEVRLLREKLKRACESYDVAASQRERYAERVHAVRISEEKAAEFNRLMAEQCGMPWTFLEAGEPSVAHTDAHLLEMLRRSMVGNVYLWEPSKPHARSRLLVESIELRDNGDCFVVGIDPDTRKRSWNDLTRFMEAIAVGHAMSHGELAGELATTACCELPIDTD